MALFNFNKNNITRSNGGTACGAASYQRGEKFIDYRYGTTHNYSKREDIAYTNVLLPTNAPEKYYDSEIMWNAAELAESRSNSRVAHIFKAALPREFSLDENIELVNEFATEYLVKDGMCCDIAIHDNGEGNPHTHILTPTREVTSEGFSGKRRDWNDKQLLIQWRESWAKVCNEKFLQKGLECRISHESYAVQDIDKPYQREATVHLGKDATALERRGVQTELGNKNREITERNKELELGLGLSLDRSYGFEL